ncbi:porin [Corallincola spongiicola]|uniref:Porin n=1 Tax=Corallincola spongiicola TaxID=2520508 RepID=A0ABY1WS65_9GAMM|nr:porin [Corallincola spongiicola]TAA47586.1 porin [Corallincola spongiicola]
MAIRLLPALLLLAATPISQAAPTLYGKLNLAVQQSDDGTTARGSYSEVASYASRFGLKGDSELADGWGVFYKLEFQVNIDDDEGDALDSRDQYVGLSTPAGDVMIGRRNTIFKEANNGADQFGDVEGDIKYLFAGDNRLGDNITWKSPIWNQLQLGATVIMGDNSKQKDKEDGDEGYNLALFYGDKSLKKQPLWGAVAYEDGVAGYSNTVLVGRAALGDWQFGAMWQNTEDSESNDDESGYMVNVAYLMEAWTFKAQYMASDLYKIGYTKRKDEDGNKLGFQSGSSIGVDYSFNKTTSAYLWYTINEKPESSYRDTAVHNDDASYLALGMIHKF